MRSILLPLRLQLSSIKTFWLWHVRVQHKLFFTFVINQDCQPFLSIRGARPEIVIGSELQNIQPPQSHGSWKSIIGMPDSNQLVEFDPKVRSLNMIDTQG